MTWINIIAAGCMLWTFFELLQLGSYLTVPSKEDGTFLDKVTVHLFMDVLIMAGKIAVFSKFLNLW